MKIWNLFLLPLVILFFFQNPADSQGQKRLYTAYFVSTPVVIDGYLNEAAWKRLPRTTGFKILSDPGSFTEKQTFFQIGWDKTSLYISLKCEEPDIRKVRAERQNGEALWVEDGVEIFLAPEFPLYHQLVLNSAGKRHWLQSNAHWKASASRDERSYILEIGIPFGGLGKVPADRDEWRFNVSRNTTVFDSGGDRHTTWAGLEASFHDTANFGVLRFSISTLKPKDAKRITKTVEKEIFANLISRSAKAVNGCVEHLNSLKKEFGSRVDTQTLSRLEGNVASLREILGKDEPSYKELKDIRTKAETLFKEIVTLKLKFLLD